MTKHMPLHLFEILPHFQEPNHDFKEDCPSFILEEIAQEKIQMAYEKGKEDTQTLLNPYLESHQKIEAFLTAFQERVDRFLGAYQEMEKQSVKKAILIAMHVIKNAMPHFYSTFIGNDILEFVIKTQESLLKKNRITVQIHNSYKEYLEKHLLDTNITWNFYEEPLCNDVFISFEGGLCEFSLSKYADAILLKLHQQLEGIIQ